MIHIIELFESCDYNSIMRSEEHTSELQSLRHLVCRLLLEKKKVIRRILPQEATSVKPALRRAARICGREYARSRCNSSVRAQCWPRRTKQVTFRVATFRRASQVER